MSASSPEELVVQIQKAYDAYDAEAVLRLFDPDAVLVVAPGRTVTGPELCAAIVAFLASRPRAPSRLSAFAARVVPAIAELRRGDPAPAPSDDSGYCWSVLERARPPRPSLPVPPDGEYEQSPQTGRSAPCSPRPRMTP